MDAIVAAVGAALVAAMATDSWQQARTSVLGLWRRLRPSRQVEGVEGDLDMLRQRVVTARREDQADAERVLVEVWQGRLQELLLDDPAVAGELRQILERVLAPMLTPAERAHIGQITMTASPQGTGIVNQFVGDQYNQTTQIIRASAAPVKAFRSLRADVATFTGRGEQILEITQAISHSNGAVGGVVAIHAINGMPGVGKTALAVHVSHLMADRFPDGQLFVDLHAHSIDHAPADPADVLATLLSATGMAPEQIPDGARKRADEWRDRVAGKRLLLVLDNAAADEQVQPLLPGSADCLVLVTSRRRLAGLCRDYGATILPLGVLPEPDAVALFTRIFPHSLTAADQRAAVELVRLCGYLPLAITIVAAGIDPDERTSVADLLTDLDSAQDRLAGIDAHLDEQELGVAGAFDLSYQRVPSDHQRTLRLLGATPGADIDPYAAAAVTDLPLEVVRGHLRALRAHRLVDRPAHDRYRLHDLIAVYVRARTSAEEREQALERLLDHYQHAAAIAAAGISRYHVRPTRARGPGYTIPDLSSQALAIRWLRAERANLLACLHHIRRYRQHTRLVDLTISLGVLLDQDGPPAERNGLRAYALDVCKEIGDRHGEAWTLSELGAFENTTSYLQATDLQEQALTIFRELGDRNGEMFALLALGDLLMDNGDWAQGASLQEQALTISRETGNGYGEVRALSQLGDKSRMTGDYPRARGLQEQALIISREIGSLGGEAWALSGLGTLWQIAGHYPRAVDLQEQALTIARVIGDRHVEAIALCRLGALRRITGDYSQATALQEQALTIRWERGDRLCEAWSLVELGAVRRVTGDYSRAADLLEQALTISGENGRHGDYDRVLVELGALRRVTGDYSQAADLLEQALTICREISDRNGEAEILNQQGALLFSSGDPPGALERHRQALELARAVGNPLEEARGLAGAGRCAMAMGIADGPTDLRNALEIFRRIGAAEALDLTAEVDCLPTAHP